MGTTEKDKILVDIQENKKYSHITISEGLSSKTSNILRKVMIKYDSDFKRMANEE